MWLHTDLNDAKLRSMIREGTIRWGGNRKLKIFGTLHCKSGKRMHQQNRIFFSSLQEAESLSYRPCGHCLKSAYQHWKNGLI